MLPDSKPVHVHSLASFSLKSPQRMRAPLSAIVCCIWVLDCLRPRDPALVLEEIQALRQEVARTRDLVYELEAASGTCVWQLWGQGWLLKLSGIADLVLIVLLVRGWFQRQRATLDSSSTLGTSDAGALPSSTTSVLSADSRVEEEGSGSSTASPVRGGRPTRPSDLRKWQTSR